MWQPAISSSTPPSNQEIWTSLWGSRETSLTCFWGVILTLEDILVGITSRWITGICLEKCSSTCATSANARTSTPTDSGPMNLWKTESGNSKDVTMSIGWKESAGTASIESPSNYSSSTTSRRKIRACTSLTPFPTPIHACKISYLTSQERTGIASRHPGWLRVWADLTCRFSLSQARTKRRTTRILQTVSRLEERRWCW